MLAFISQGSVGAQELYTDSGGHSPLFWVYTLIFWAFPGNWSIHRFGVQKNGLGFGKLDSGHHYRCIVPVPLIKWGDGLRFLDFWPFRSGPILRAGFVGRNFKCEFSMLVRVSKRIYLAHVVPGRCSGLSGHVPDISLTFYGHVLEVVCFLLWICYLVLCVWYALLCFCYFCYAPAMFCYIFVMFCYACLIVSNIIF